MNKDQKFPKGMIIGVACMAAVFVLAVLVVAVVITRRYPVMSPASGTTGISSQADPVNQTIDEEKITNKLKLMQEYISKYYLFDQDAKASENGIYEGFVNGLGDQYSEYYDEAEWESFKEEYSGSFGGIGAVITVNKNGENMVLSVYDDTPASKAGVQPGDIFYKVDGKDVLGMDLDLLVQEYVRGVPGTTVNITFLRGEDRQEVEMNIVRDVIVSPTVAHKMLDDNIGYVEVVQFTEATVADFKDAVDELISQGAEGLVIDLRDNPGGVFASAIMMADYLMPDGQVITYTSDKNGNSKKSTSSDGHEVKLPIVTLVNGNSASASEVFTGALQDSGVSKVVGNQSFGKGIVQNIFQLGDGTGIKLTVDHYFTPSGRDLHGQGITPNVEMDLSDDCKYYSDEHDNQLKKAVELIKSEKK